MHECSTDIPFINAVGDGPKLAYHKAKTPSTLTVLPLASSGAPACLCELTPAPFGSGVGKLTYVSAAAFAGNASDRRYDRVVRCRTPAHLEPAHAS